MVEDGDGHPKATNGSSCSANHHWRAGTVSLSCQLGTVLLGAKFVQGLWSPSVLWWRRTNNPQLTNTTPCWQNKTKQNKKTKQTIYYSSWMVQHFVKITSFNNVHKNTMLWEFPGRRFVSLETLCVLARSRPMLISFNQSSVGNGTTSHGQADNWARTENK